MIQESSSARRRSWCVRARGTFEDVKASGWFWPGIVLSVLVFGPFLLHPPTAWMLKDITLPTLLAAVLMVMAASWGRIGWCFAVPLVTAPWIAWGAMQARWYIRILPLDVEATGIIEMGVENDIFSGCGTIVYGLAPSTLKALRTAKAEERQRFSGSSARFPTWVATPIPVHDNQHWRMGLNCGLSRAWLREIGDAMRQEGGFVAEERRSSTIRTVVTAFPAKRIAVFVYRDR